MTETQAERRPVRRVLEAIMAEAWAIHEPALHQIIAIAEREGEDPTALAARLGRPLDRARTVELRGSTAIVPIQGPIFRYANLFTEMSGATSLEVLARDFRTAIDDPQVASIVLAIDSPGGEASGISEMAGQIRAAHAIKPVTAYVGGMGGSAAYWLTAAAGEVVVADTALLGSIGVVMGHVDTSERDARSGVRRTQFVSSQSPDKRPDLATEGGRATVQALVDRMAMQFIGAVAMLRGTDAATVAERFGRGGLIVGSDAVAAGMADRIGSLEGLLAELAAKAAQSGISRGRGAGAAAVIAHKEIIMSEQKAAAPEVTAETLAAEHPALIEAVRAAARAEGVVAGAEAERARILGIEAQALPGHEALIASLKRDGSTSPAEAAVQVLAAERGKLGSHLDRIRSDAGRIPALDPAGGGLAADGTPEGIARAEYARDPKLQAEFRSAERYLGWKLGARALSKTAA